MCAHCKDVVPAHAVQNEGPSFCCKGCDTVYTLLHQQNLTDYYQYIPENTPPHPVQNTQDDSRVFDQPSFIQKHVRSLTADVQRVEWYVPSAHCAACVWLVEKLPSLHPGVLKATLQIRSGVVEVDFNPALTQLSDVAQTLTRLGYRPYPSTRHARTMADKKTDHMLLRRMGVAAACAGNVMLFAAALYSGLFSPMQHTLMHICRYASLLLTLPCMVYAGSVFFQGAWESLKTRTPHMDVPIALALAAGFITSAINTFKGHGEVYFDTLTVLVFLLLVGRFLLRKGQRNAAAAADLIDALAPQSALLCTPEGLRTVAIDTLQHHDEVWVHTQQPVPVDGTVVSGQGHLDRSILTGESVPVEITQGSFVHAGTLYTGEGIRIQVAATGAHTRIGAIAHTMQSIASAKVPIVLMANTLAVRFTYAVIALAASTMAVRLWLGDSLAVAVDHTMALLIVTCPCALSLATPLAVSAAIGKAARAGIMVKSAEALELLSRIKTVVFDKTKTLTTGRFSVVLHQAHPHTYALLKACEAHIPHPIARTLQEAFKHAPDVHVTEVVYQASAGLTAVHEKTHIRIGSPRFVLQPHTSCSLVFKTTLEQCEQQALTTVVVSENNTVTGVLGLGDTLRPDALASVQRLQHMGIEVFLASGDHTAVVHKTAHALGLNPQHVQAHMSPEDKGLLLQTLSAQKPTLMVGDGVNDTLALAQATCSIAVHGSAEASLQACDVFLAKPSIEAVVQTLQGARNTYRIIRTCIGFSIAYNLLGMFLSLTGRINPLVAALLMPASSLTVLAIASFSTSFKPRALP